jgi:hypothetical protein
MGWLHWPTLETVVMTFITLMTLFYGWVSCALAWRERPMVVWDYEQQRWRSARLVKAERDRAPGRCR